jgi:ribonuclease HI
MRGIDWSNPTIGKITGCGLIEIKRNGTRLPGAEHLYRIVISESMYLIWKIKCEWRILWESDPTCLHEIDEIHNKWVYTLNTRLKFDCLMTNCKRYGSKALWASLIEKT